MEVLRNLKDEYEQPNFGYANWTSSTAKNDIADHHPEYDRVRTPDVGNGIIDIVYNDTERVFTRLLIEKGYLDQAKWTSDTGKKRQPENHIEVKTSVGDLDWGFFLSYNQYLIVSFTDTETQENTKPTRRNSQPC